MRVLYAAYRHDPRDPAAGSGADYGFYSALVGAGFEVQIVGPFGHRASLPERVLKRVYQIWSQKKYTKFHLSLAWRTSQAVNRAARRWKPDVVISLFPSPLVYYNYDAPCLYRLDTTFLGQEQQWPLYGRLPLAICVWQERRVFHHCAKIITHSTWSEGILREQYGVDRGRIAVLPNPAALPLGRIPSWEDLRAERTLGWPLKLLLVGRDYRRKGVDIALEVTQRLNETGPAGLTVCASQGPDRYYVEYVGPFDKNDPAQLEQYMDLYRKAHFLLHPARFDASPIAPSEAAAFGLPTMTNNAGGIGTSVAHEVSGIVLPKDSPAQDYVDAILGYLDRPERYRALCQTTRQRYDQELNWAAVGERVANIIREAVEEKTRQALS